MSNSVLVVEDQEDIAAPLVRTLQREGYDVTWVDSGKKALELLAPPYDAELVLLDLGLPDMDGLEVCKARDNGYEGGIMILTARDAEIDLVVGLDAGADDYLAKPFALAVLQARVRALLRRSVRSSRAPTTTPCASTWLPTGSTPVSAR